MIRVHEVGMFTQRVKAVWSCLGLMFSQSQLGRFNSQMDLENTLPSWPILSAII